MKKHLLTLGLLLLAIFGFSQATVTWTGGGTNNNWNNVDNWDSSAEPAAGDLVVVNTTAANVTINGTQTNIPAQIKVTGANALTLDLDLTVGNGTDDQHGLQINDMAQINIGTNAGTPRTVTVQAPSTKDGVRFNSNMTNADKTKLNIRAGSTLNITSARDGISSSGTTNEATAITNDGTLNISGTTNSGINMAETLFNNNGILTISNFGGDGIRIGKSDGTSVVAGKINNNGTTTITVPAGAGVGIRAIEAYAGTTNGKFFNFNVLTVNEGGNGTQTLGLLGGELNNEPNATFNIGDGRVRIEDNGKFINEGLFLKTTDNASGVFVAATGGTASNRAFFKYGSTANSLFSNSGGNANGVNLNEIQDADAMMSIDLNNVSYSYSHDGSAYGTSDASGVLNFPIGGLTTFPNSTLTIDAFPGFSLMITNAGEDAYLGGLFLPIDLVSFKAKLQDETVMLFWQTASELNNDYMVVEHSMDGQRFKEVGKVIGAGNSTTFINYELEHTTPQTGINYYRLRQVDFDGTTDFSEIVSVTLERTKNANPLNIYPNVITSDVNINIDLADLEPSEVTIDVMNMNGQIVKSFTDASGGNVLLSTGQFSNGMYIVRVSGYQTATQIGRFIKK